MNGFIYETIMVKSAKMKGASDTIAAKSVIQSSSVVKLNDIVFTIILVSTIQL